MSLEVCALTWNTHVGLGPAEHRSLFQKVKDRITEERKYADKIAQWLAEHNMDFDVVGLQEVRHRSLGVGQSQYLLYQGAGYDYCIRHTVGSVGFKYENVLLSNLQASFNDDDKKRFNVDFKKRVFLARCGFTLAPFKLGQHVVRIGNTHLHPYNPKKRAKQAVRIVRYIEGLKERWGGVLPLLFMGDFNTVPPECPIGPFDSGEPDPDSYVDDKTFEIFSDAGLDMIPHYDEPEYYTYPVAYQGGNLRHTPNRTLDYILFTKDHWNVLEYKVKKDVCFSDHYPVMGRFELKI